MTRRRIRFTATARGHVLGEKEWWLHNRDYPDTFADELEHALRIVASLPGVGTVYENPEVPGVRRLFLRKSACHVYFTFDEHAVIVRAVWSARRQFGPTFGP